MAYPKWTASTRLHYLWNAKNTDPNLVLFGPEARSTQAGQAFFANFATEYEVVKKLYVGVNGYYLNQFTDTKVNDHNVSDDVNVFGLSDPVHFIVSQKIIIYFLMSILNGTHAIAPKELVV